jgi:hypothetical protein
MQQRTPPAEDPRSCHTKHFHCSDKASAQRTSAHSEGHCNAQLPLPEPLLAPWAVHGGYKCRTASREPVEESHPVWYLPDRAKMNDLSLLLLYGASTSTRPLPCPPASPWNRVTRIRKNIVAPRTQALGHAAFPSATATGAASDPSDSEEKQRMQWTPCPDGSTRGTRMHQYGTNTVGVTQHLRCLPRE